ncbi:MAG: ASPIC/UnbV domain-containing protein [Candidatus Krumholzibacteriia bacterium]
MNDPKWNLGPDLAIRSIEWGDFNHDNTLDLVVIESGAEVISDSLYSRAAALKVDPATGFGLIRPVPGDPQKWFGSQVGDLNLDGQDDVLLLPEEGLPLLYLSDGPFGGGYGFSNDRGFGLGLKATTGDPAPVTIGGVLADFNGDRDFDLYLGRPGDQSVFFRNVRPAHIASDDSVSGDIKPNDGPNSDNQRWAHIILESSGATNTSLIGTRVRVTGGGHSQTKFVDGGSGRGGQNANQLIFGLGDYQDPTVNVDVVWAFADTLDNQSRAIRVTHGSANVGDTTIFYDHGGAGKSVPAISIPNSSLQFSYQAFPGGADWVFEWDSSIMTDITQDAVQITLYGSCSGALPGVYAAGDPDVEISGYPTATGFHHVLILRNQICGGKVCSLSFKAYSGLDATDNVWSSESKTWGFKVCMQP